MLDESGSMLCTYAGCAYSLENWDLEKKAAITMTEALQRNLSNMTVGAAQFSVGSRLTAAQSANLPIVKGLINNAGTRAKSRRRCGRVGPLELQMSRG